MFQSNLPYAMCISDMVIFDSVLLIYTHIWLSSFWTELRCAHNAKHAVMVILFQINAIKNCYSSYLSKSCRSEWLHLPWKNNFQTIGHPKMKTENYLLTAMSFQTCMLFFFRKQKDKFCYAKFCASVLHSRTVLLLIIK